MYKTILLISILFWYAMEIQAQCNSNEISVAVTIVPDNYPSETSWKIETYTGTVVASGTTNSVEICLPADSCYKFTILDSYGDGICCGYGNGSYSVSVDGETIVSGGEFGYFESTFFNCQPGQVCDESLDVMPEVWYESIYDDTWYKVFVEQAGVYMITTCATANTCNTAIWLYDTCYLPNVSQDYTGALYYSNSGCGNQAHMETFLAADQWYYIRIGDQNDNCSGQAISWKYKYIGPLSGCMDPTACNFNPNATVSDSTACFYPGDPECPDGPDLIVLQAPLVNSVYVSTVNNSDNCLIQEQCVKGYGVREVIRFTTHIENIGTQNFHIGPKPSNPNAPSTQWTYDNCHGHWHYEGYAEYLLFDQDGTEIPVGFKNGFFVMDLDCSYGGGTPTYNCNIQGISAQCGDIYGSYLQCQWIDITDVEAGEYILVVRVNWDQSADALGNYETDYTNNWAQVCINLTRHPVTNAPSITVIQDCAPYVDCLGEIYGPAQPDCKGVCNGTALRGDINEDGQRNYQDVTRYMYESLADTILPVTCIDLNDDNRITVTDAALILDCVLHGNAPPADHTHTPCVYPYNVQNPFDTVYLRVGNVNLLEGYVDIEMKNPSNTYLGFQFSVSGIQLSGLQSLPMDFETNMMYDAAKGEIISLSFQEDLIDKSNTYQPLVRLFFSEILAEEVCIESITAFVNKDYEEVNTLIEGACGNLNPVRTNDIAYLPVRMVPNPMTDQTTIWYDAANSQSAKMELIDLQGRVLRVQHQHNGLPFVIHRNSLPAGLYRVRIITDRGLFSGTLAIQ